MTCKRTMAPNKCVVFLVVVTFLWTSHCEVAVHCVLKKTCILPCSFRRGDEIIIHWVQTAGNTPVHSFYYNKDQLTLQDQRFRGRTSLFKDQLTKGNASLQLTGVDFQDRGRYKCYTSTITGNEESFIDLHVEVPVREVNIEQVGNRITCSSEGIYPEPELTWSTSPPSALNPPDTPKANLNEQHLFSISSSLTVSHDVSNLVYRCTVSAGRSKRTAALLEPMFIKRSQAETTIPCNSTNTPWKELIWTFNHNQTILSWTRTNLSYTVSDGWKQQVKDVSETGDLILKDPSLNHMGTYTCKHSTEEETFVQSTFLENGGPDPRNSPTGIIAGVIVAVVILAAAAGLGFYIIRRKQCFKTQKRENNKKGAKESELKTLGEQNNGKKQTSDEGDESSYSMKTFSPVDTEDRQFVPEESDCKT